MRVTYYWVAYEGDYLCTVADTDLGTCSGDVIATVCPEFAEAARLEGTARLVDGRMINIGACSCAGGFDCFIVLDTDLYPWGMGNRSNPLVPFVSVATDTDVIVSGTILYSPEIDGVALPEEMFYRGYFQPALERRLPPGRRWFGVPLGWAAVITAALFALGHFLGEYNPVRLGPFFPSLVFSWLRNRRGSLWGAVAFHALANILGEVLFTFYK